MAHATQSIGAFSELVELIGEMRDDYVLSTERFTDELDVLEGMRYLLHLVSEATELLVEGDPERPRFSSIVSPARKFLGDNPDSLYQQAVIRGDRAYRIRGRRDHQSYISFTVHGPDPAGGINGPILADLNDTQFDLGPDGTFELTLLPAGRDGADASGSVVRLDPAARMVIVRNYYLRERSVQTDPDMFVRLEIEPLDDAGPAPALDDATLAARLRDATAFMRATTMGMRIFGAPATVPFVANEPNTVGPPWSFRNAGVDAAGAVDIFYSSGTFDLQPDEALVMEGHLPEAVFTNVMLWNVHMQTFEYRSRRSSLNAAQMATGHDGAYRIVISERDPHVVNWLDTGGHRHGTIFWRFLLPATDPEHPQCRVVPVADVAGLPA